MDETAPAGYNDGTDDDCRLTPGDAIAVTIGMSRNGDDLPAMADEVLAALQWAGYEVVRIPEEHRG